MSLHPETSSTTASIWERLSILSQAPYPHITELFSSTDHRVENMSFKVGEIYADFSKQRICPNTLELLYELTRSKNLERARDDFFNGLKINRSEDRAVLHPALRGIGGDADIRAHVSDMRARTAGFATKIRSEGKIKSVVHIGIGGSDLGPRLCATALSAYSHDAIDLRFVENIDGASLNDALKGLDPKSTLVIMVSKSLSTIETQVNAESARSWLRNSLGDKTSDHMIAITANRDGALNFGIAETQVFDFWDWVGGRYSLWSAVGLSLQIALGPKVFDQLLSGAAEMDTHFMTAPIEDNLPIMMALAGIWNRNFLEYGSQAVITYSRRLRKLPSFLQQLEMESNGKSATQDGHAAVPTCPIIWGEEGTNSQHAFFQHLHQGTQGAPIDFIAVLKDSENRPHHHNILLANCFAQSEALMHGKSKEKVVAELKAEGYDAATIAALAPQKVFPGNRPSTTLLLDALTPRALGNLIALYEHKVFVQSVIWDINAFDQWGVELGKTLAKTILDEFNQNRLQPGHDPSTGSLISKVLEHNT